MIIENRIDNALKPDVYDIFPSYSKEELYDRLDNFPFHLATSLNPKLIRRCIHNLKCREGLKDFFNSTFDKQRVLLSEVFEHREISTNIVKAIRKVPRDIFVPDAYKRYSYLNTFIPFSKYSCLSSLNVVVLMLEMLSADAGNDILEIGIGSGYHACCLFEVVGECNMWGVEMNPDFFRLGADAIKLAGYNINLLLGNEDLLIKMEKSFDRIYTASAIHEIPTSIKTLLRDQGNFVATRPASLEEYQSEKVDSWLRLTYPSYESYYSAQWYQSFGCLTTWKRDKENFLETTSVYDVVFVPYHKAGVEDVLVEDDPFSDIYYN